MFMAATEKLRGLLIIVSSLLTHFVIIHGNPQILNTIEFMPIFFLVSVVTVGLVYIAYPVLGWIGDRYIAAKYWILLTGVFLMILSMVASLSLAILNYKLPNKIQFSKEFGVMIVPILVLLMIGLGLFESNALQFGVDQIANLSTKQVLVFIKWYFWTQYSGNLIIFYFIFVFVKEDVFKPRNYRNETLYQNGGGALFASSIVLLSASILVIFMLSWCSRAIDTVRNTNSSLKLQTILQMIKFVIKQRPHPQEPNRFTFDACIERNGGPFTVDVVENIKQSLRIILLIIACSAFHLSGDTYSLMEQLIRLTNKCPPITVTLLLGINPNHLSYLVVLVAVPLEIFFTGTLNLRETGMLKRIFIGLLFALAGIFSQLAINIGALTHIYQPHKEQMNTSITQLTSQCLQRNEAMPSMNNSMLEYETDDTRVILLFCSIAIPQIFNGLAHWLVCMTMLQFICVQASREIQGLLIGAWYATYAISFLVVGLLDAFIKNHVLWFCYKGTSVLIMIISNFLYVSLAYGYQYRERDDGITPSLEESVIVRVLPVTNPRNRNYRTFVEQQ